MLPMMAIGYILYGINGRLFVKCPRGLACGKRVDVCDHEGVSGWEDAGMWVERSDLSQDDVTFEAPSSFDGGRDNSSSKFTLSDFRMITYRCC